MIRTCLAPLAPFVSRALPARSILAAVPAVLLLGAVPALLLLCAVPALADPVSGTWRTQASDDGTFALVRMAPCGAHICGTMISAHDASGAKRDSDHVGKAIVWDMVAQGGGAYADGRIYAPDRDKTYRSKMDLAGDRLTVSGCVGPICRKQVWTRAD